MGNYANLIERLPLRPIKSEQQLDDAILVATDLYGNIEGLTDDEQDYLDVLSTLIHRYEQQQHTRPGNFTPIQHLRSLFEANHMKSGELSKLLSVTPGRASEIWNENRDLSKAHILVLAERFCVSADLFLGKSLRRAEDKNTSANKNGPSKGRVISKLKVKSVDLPGFVGAKAAAKNTKKTSRS